MEIQASPHSNKEAIANVLSFGLPGTRSLLPLAVLAIFFFPRLDFELNPPFCV